MAAVAMLLVLLANAAHLSIGIGQDLQLYDCHVGYDNGMWKKLWDAKWKAWCCEHESLGCPSTSTLTITSTSKTTMTVTTSTATTVTTTTTTETSTSTATVTTTTTNLGCWNTNCTFEDETATCAARIKVAHGNPEFWTKANNLAGEAHTNFICSSAVGLVKSQCSSCDVCSVDSYCKNNMQDTCLETYCSYNGVGDTCSNRLHSTLLNHPDVKQSATPCSTASEIVNSICPVCGACSSTWWCEQQGELGPRPAAKPHRSKALMNSVMPAKCGADCELDGHSASCSDRMKWAMTNNPQITMSSHACLAAGELVKSQCPVCGECSSQWFCDQPAQQQQTDQVMFKYETFGTDGLLARTGFKQPMSVMPIMVFIVTGMAFALRWRRQSSTQVNVADVANGQALDGYADPLCPASDTREASEDA